MIMFSHFISFACMYFTTSVKHLERFLMYGGCAERVCYLTGISSSVFVSSAQNLGIEGQ